MRQRIQLTEAHLKALEEVKSNGNVIVLCPDKGSGIVVTDKVCYKEKMLSILKDEREFGVGKIKNDPQKLEKKISMELKTLLQVGLIRESTVKQLRPLGSQMPQIYGLPKLHEEGIPLQPMMSMCNLPQHKLDKRG
ncbi:unnamed protein product [Echinostoma caproni]|uniref:Reverse transcriptase domain-containing protein n=1 Tax=Echinostoma caproni TaxID=27848 RepID=A0A183AUN2_9TREM|nr:unnamed protein product [Echinostoma caproni]